MHCVIIISVNSGHSSHQASDKVRGESKCIQKYSTYCVGDLDSNRDGAEAGWGQNKDNNNEN